MISLPLARAAALLVGLITLLPLPVEAQLSVARAPLTAREQSRLDRGELVVRATSERRGALSLMGGVSFQVIDAEPDSVWRALGDVRQWRRMLPQVVESREVAHVNDARTIFIRHESGPASVSYHLTARYQASTRDVVFMLDNQRENDIRAAWGFLSIRAYGDDRTIVTYGVMADVGVGLVAGLVRGAVHEWILKVPWTMKQHVEAMVRRALARGHGAPHG